MTACRADRTMRALLIAPLMAAGLLAAGAAAPAFAQNPQKIEIVQIKI